MEIIARIKQNRQQKQRRKAQRQHWREINAKRYDVSLDDFFLRTKSKLQKEHRWHEPEDSILFEKIQRYGKPFLGGFKPFEISTPKGKFIVRLAFECHEHESPVTIKVESTLPGRNRGEIGTVRLSFEENAICIETVQGHMGRLRALKRFEGAVGIGMPWPNYLIKKVLATARRLGYTKAQFRDPTTLYWYKHPMLWGDQTVEGLQKQISNFYAKVRQGTGFKKRRGDYWVQKL
ncbi:MAG: hypothetical protein PHD95_03690 [Candidatus ainarchaeum sp.]|nr:hypothetical protein [Candidatus ainarchaeum sp.]